MKTFNMTPYWLKFLFSIPLNVYQLCLQLYSIKSELLVFIIEVFIKFGRKKQTLKNNKKHPSSKKKKEKKTENDINQDWKNRKSQFLLFWVHCLRILQHFVGLSKLHTPSFLRTVINIWSDLLTFYQNYYYTSALISIHLVLNIGWTIIYFIKKIQNKTKIVENQWSISMTK